MNRWLLWRIGPPAFSGMLAFQWVLFGIAYPFVAGLDADRQSLYFDICALVFLTSTSWQLLDRSFGPWATVWTRRRAVASSPGIS